MLPTPAGSAYPKTKKAKKKEHAKQNKSYANNSRMSLCHDVCPRLLLFLLLRTLTYQFRLRLSSSCCSQLTPEMEASRAACHWAGPESETESLCLQAVDTFWGAT